MWHIAEQEKVGDVSISGETKRSEIEADQNAFEEDETYKRSTFLNLTKFVINSKCFYWMLHAY